MSINGFKATTFRKARYLIKRKNGSSLYSNRYCLYTMLGTGFFCFKTLVQFQNTANYLLSTFHNPRKLWSIDSKQSVVRHHTNILCL